MHIANSNSAPAARTKTVCASMPCYHCGTMCINGNIAVADKIFCCEGCRLVYELLNDNGLCDYYKLQSHPGLSRIKPVSNHKYAYLDDESTANQLCTFTDGRLVIVTLYIPGVHCTSCMWLLEHLYSIDPAITESRLNFTNKEVTIHFLKAGISLRQLVELLATIGYEPYISLTDTDKKAARGYNKQRIYKLGIAGFCFGNIMMMSFPEYLSHRSGIEHQYAQLFRILNLGLSVPVLFFCASEFFISAYKGLRQSILNIDAPIALALIITYCRSIYEIITGTGSGYLDSMSGIVFFMLVGRVVQERAYRSISFNRDYKSYFPIAVHVVTNSGLEVRKLNDLKEADIVQLYHDDIIPADAIIMAGNAHIDYSFVTGESESVTINVGQPVYAGGRQTGSQLTARIVKPVAGSYLTSLWNHHAFANNKEEQNQATSAVHILSKYFTYILFFFAAITAAYWAINDASKLLPSVSAMLIVACPCALLLSATYTNGNLLRIFSNNGLFLRHASVIEQLGAIDHIVFDKTGTLTHGGGQYTTAGHVLTQQEQAWVYSVASSSKHPNSKALASCLDNKIIVPFTNWQEVPGKGIRAVVNDNTVRIGSAAFIGIAGYTNASVYVEVNGQVVAFCFKQGFRTYVGSLLTALAGRYGLSLLSGDHNAQQSQLEELFSKESDLRFEQKPIDKLNYIAQLQQQGKKVIMIGDGLNDAGALQQSNVGITLADDINNFTPACDAILDAEKLALLPALLQLARWGRGIVLLSFAVSILYNIVGLSIAVQGHMNPMTAAVLMPVSTLSIVLITTGAGSLAARLLHLRLNAE